MLDRDSKVMLGGVGCVAVLVAVKLLFIGALLYVCVDAYDRWLRA